MIEETIRKIEEQIRQAGSVATDKKEELLKLLAALKREVAEISRTDAGAADAITGHTEVSTREATRSDLDQDKLQDSLRGLSASVAGFEKSHPKLVEVVNRICVTLSGLGI